MKALILALALILVSCSSINQQPVKSVKTISYNSTVLKNVVTTKDLLKYATTDALNPKQKYVSFDDIEKVFAEKEGRQPVINTNIGGGVGAGKTKHCILDCGDCVFIITDIPSDCTCITSEGELYIKCTLSQSKTVYCGDCDAD